MQRSRQISTTPHDIRQYYYIPSFHINNDVTHVNAKAGPTERAASTIVVNFIAAAEAIMAMMSLKWEFVTLSGGAKKASNTDGKISRTTLLFWNPKPIVDVVTPPKGKSVQISSYTSTCVIQAPDRRDTTKDSRAHPSLVLLLVLSLVQPRMLG